MWPKLLMQYLPQLIELLPHVSRVVPMADKYLASKGANDEKLDALASGVRGDMGKVAKAHLELAARLDEFAGYVGDAANEAKRARMAAELAQNHAAEIEAQMRSLRLWVRVGLVLIVVLLVAMLSLLLREPMRG